MSGEPRVELRELERLDVRGLEAAVALEHEVGRSETPWVPQRDLNEERALFTHHDPGARFRRFVAVARGRVVGSAMLSLPLLENVEKAMGAVVVHPEARRRGVGTALLERLVDEARAAARQVLLSAISLPAGATDEHPARRFARAMRFEAMDSETERSLRVPVEPARLARLEAEVAAHLAGRYRLQSFLDGVDESLQPGLCTAMNRLNADTPSGDVDFDEESLTPQRYRDALAAQLAAGTHELMTLALTPGNEVVAYAVLTMPASNPRGAHEGGTFVVSAHRGHRLGLAVELGNLRALAELAPQVERVHYEISQSNEPMLAINDALGAKVVGVRDLVVRTL